ncbi:MAG: LytTR family DNA-binding domain-containing protein [Bacteroidota bacterium]
MRVLIIEDEPLAAERLEQLILRYEPHIEMVGQLDSVIESVEWLQVHPRPDLIFVDIHLADGLSFQVFERVQVNCPVIFTTAYDAYAIQAFKLNSVDYLLKPLDYEGVAGAMDKFIKLHWDKNPQAQKPALIDMAALQALFQGQMQQPGATESPAYKSRFVVKQGEQLVAVPIEEILYFYAEEKVSFLRTQSGKRYIIDFTLGELEAKVDPRLFFRVNRTYLARFESIEQMVSFSNRRLKLTLKHAAGERVLVSREKVAEFKAWLDR